MSTGFLGMMGMGGGTARNMDAVANSVSKIASDLQMIDKLVESIGSKSTGMKSLFRNVGKIGSGSGLGTSTPLFTSSATFSGGSMPTASGVTNNFLGSAAMRYPGIAFGVGAVGVVGGAAWQALPNVGDALSQRQAMFGATLGQYSNGRMPNYIGLKNQMNSAFGGYASGVSSQENVVNYMASYGMGMGSRSFMGQTAGMSLLTGMSQEQSAATSMAIATPQISNQLMMFGIRSMNSNGQPTNFADTVKQLMLRVYGHMPSVSEVNQGIGPSGHLRKSFESVFMGQPQLVDSAITYARLLAANGGNTNVDTGTAAGQAMLKKYNITNASVNPNSKQQSYNATQSVTTADYGDKLIQGWDKALSTAQEIEKALQDWKGMLGPMAAGKGYGQGLLGTHSGNALVNGLDNLVGLFGGTLGAGMGLKLLSRSKLGTSLLGKLGVDATELAPAAAGGSALGAIAGKVLPAAGMFAATHWLSSQIMHRVGATSSSSAYNRTLATIDKTALNMIQGGLTGLTAAGPGGLFAGMGTGLGISLSSIFGSSGAGIDYGDIGSAGSITGTPGGGGTGSSSGNTSQGGKNSAPAGVSGAVAYAYQQAHNPTRDWYDMCDNFVARCYGRAYSGYYTAYQHWQSIPDRIKHTDGNPPAGALVFWSTGAGRAGHVALGVGGGKIASTDILRRGKVDIVPVGLIAQRWHATYLGWSQPYFGGKIVAGGADKSDPGSTGSTQGQTGRSSAAGMTSSTVQPYGQNIDASSVGSISVSDFSISSIVSSTISNLMASGAALFSTGSSGISSSKRSDSTGSSNTASAPTSASSAGGALGVYRDARAAGFDPRTAALMTAIAGAESGWNPHAVGDVGLENNTWGPSVGLWQVRSLRNQMGSGQVRDASRLSDPMFNARSAYSIFRSQGLSAWSTYTSGAYRAYMKDAQAAESSDANLPHYSQGAWKVDKDQIAKIHSNEMIVPAPLAEAVRDSISKHMAGQGSGGRRVIELNFNATGNITYDSRQLFDAVKKCIEEDESMTILGRA